MARFFRTREKRWIPTTVTTAVGVGLDSQSYERLAKRCDDALQKSRRRGKPVLAGVSVAVSPAIDSLARMTAARQPETPWSYFAQRSHGNRCVATLGEVAVVEASGPRRFAEVTRSCAEVLEGGLMDDPSDRPDAPPGAGVIWTGGFAFFDDAALGDAWGKLPAARFSVPAISIASNSDSACLSVNVRVTPDDDISYLMAGVDRLLEQLDKDRNHPLGPLDLSSRDASEVAIGADKAVAQSSAAPAHYERAVADALQMIQRGDLEKVVLAREVVLRREKPVDLFAVLSQLRLQFPECTVFALGDDERVFIGATPELLIRREGRRASTLALAGSARRGADEQTDAHLGDALLAAEKDNREHDLVVKRIERTLGRLSAWIAVGENPELVKMRNIQHLATPIRAQLTEPRPVIELAGLLHPTPAVGGEPWPRAASAIRSLEGFNRGWYTGGVGWMDMLEDGEIHVALRSALIEGDRARLFAGAGIVAGSDPATELAETETKLAALLPILAGD